MPTLTIEVTDSTLTELRRHARERRVKPENVAAAAVEDFVRTAILLDRRFRDAAREVDRRLVNHAA
jgi:hypothetical protein